MRNIIQNLNLLTRLKGRKTQVRATRAPERITKRTATTGTRLALYGKVKFIQVVRLQLQHVQILICVIAVLLILCFESVC